MTPHDNVRPAPGEVIAFGAAERRLLADFTDNAEGLFHTTGESLPRRAAKYRPLVSALREMILRADTPLAGDVRDMIAGQLDKAGVRLAAITGDAAGLRACDGDGR